ncbi:unnamed protein product [Peronospora belbahrii]|uniref:Retrotransposon gag domain-containing protein n=1 Tax=Peronospora belbahrii TaxID=622444 RepID=A0ABN8DEL6_9STRA|nr:unnamed protein product [Peronospora belbahrii]
MDIDEMSAVGLSQVQQEGLQKLLPTLGSKGVEYLIAQGEEEVNKRICILDEYNKALVEHVKAQMPSSAPSPMATMTQEVVCRPKPIQMKSISSTARKVMIYALVPTAKQWAFTCGASPQDAFPTRADLKVQMTRHYAPSSQAHRNRSRFLACRQGKRELAAYVQELRTLIAAMVIDPMPEAVTVTVFMEGLRVGVARTEVFQVNPSSFEEAVGVAWNAETNFNDR